MATYKKKGQKKINKAPIEAVESDSTTAEVFNTLDETASRSEQWIEKNQKPLFSALLVVVVLILGYLAYTTYVQAPKELEAANELAFPKEHFEKAITMNVAADSIFNLALQGSDGKYGFVNIAKKYKGTAAGNLANYYAGISYLKTNDYQQAIEYLEAFSSEDVLLGPTALGAIGDAFSNLNQAEDALEYYEKAARTKSNVALTPLFLIKAANTALKLGAEEKAVELFTEVKAKYATTSAAKNIEMHINKAKYAQK